jgi:hypothetical protein
MSDLQIDPAAVQRVRDKAVSIGALAGQGRRQVGRLTSDGLGSTDLVARVTSFGEQWAAGLREVGELATSIAESLDVAESELDDVDTALSAAVPQAE